MALVTVHFYRLLLQFLTELFLPLSQHLGITGNTEAVEIYCTLHLISLGLRADPTLNYICFTTWYVWNKIIYLSVPLCCLHTSENYFVTVL